MFDHIEFTVASLSASGPIYAAIFQAIGGKVLFHDASGGEAGFGRGDVTALLLTEQTATQPKMHLCFKAASPADVDAAYAAAIKAGAKDNGAPGLRAHYAPNYYAAFVHDPDGHNIEVLCRT